MREEYWRVGNELFTKGNIKAVKCKSCLSFCVCQKKNVEFTDSTNTIYWPKNIAKKIANFKKVLSSYVSTKYPPI